MTEQEEIQRNVTQIHVEVIFHPFTFIFEKVLIKLMTKEMH